MASSVLKPKRKQTESNLQSKIKQDVKYLYPDSFYCKIPDSIWSEQTRFIPTKPFDIIIINNNTPYAIETKVHKSHRSFPISKRTREQIQNLLQFQKACNNKRQAYLLINVKYTVEDRKVNYLIYFYPDEITSDMKSVDIKGIVKGLGDPSRVILREKVNGKTVWDLRSIIN